MSNEDANYRRLVIKNFRNLAPFCTGTAEDGNDVKEFLTLNRSLEREELGGIVTLIGVNNSGKTNVLAALSAFDYQTYIDDDYTDFLYSDKVKPDVSMNVANGRYENAFKKSKDTFEFDLLDGAFKDVLFRILMEDESYELYKAYVGRQHESKYNEEQWMTEAYNQVFLNNSPSELVQFVLSERDIFMEDGRSFLDYYGSIAPSKDNGRMGQGFGGGRSYSGTIKTFPNDPVKVISDGTCIDCNGN